MKSLGGLVRFVFVAVAAATAGSAGAMEGMVEYNRMVRHSGRKNSVFDEDRARLVEVVKVEPVDDGRRIVGYRWSVRDVSDPVTPAKKPAEFEEFTFEVGTVLPAYRDRRNVVVYFDPKDVKPRTRLALVFGRGKQKDRAGNVGPVVEKIFPESFFRQNRGSERGTPPAATPKPSEP